MEMALAASAALLVGTVIGYCLSLRTICRLHRKLRHLLAKGKEKVETTKKVIWACLMMGFAWVWCSYILAYLDKEQIAESLSQVAATEIIGVVLSYCVKSAVENLSKHNHWPDKGTAPAPDSSNAGPAPEQDEPPDVGM